MPDRDGTPTPVSDPYVLAALVARESGAEVEAVHDPDTGRWTLEWTDGETVEGLERAVRAAGPEAARGLRYRRRLSESAVALGAVRLATSTDGSGPRPRVDTTAVEAFWRDVRLPSPLTEREALLVYGLLYQVHDDHRRNEAEPEQICHLVRQTGLATVLLRRPEALTPRRTADRPPCQGARPPGLAVLPGPDGRRTARTGGGRGPDRHGRPPEGRPHPHGRAARHPGGGHVPAPGAAAALRLRHRGCGAGRAGRARFVDEAGVALAAFPPRNVGLGFRREVPMPVLRCFSRPSRTYRCPWARHAGAMAAHGIRREAGELKAMT